MNEELIKAQLIVLGWSYRNASIYIYIEREPDARWFWYHHICEDYRRAHCQVSGTYPGYIYIYIYAETLEEAIEAVKSMTGIDLRLGEKVSGG